METVQINEKRSPVRLPVLNASAPAPELDLDAELAKFEAEQRTLLGLEGKKAAWVDHNPRIFTKEQRGHTTLLVGGLTIAHDYFITGALNGLGYKVVPLDAPDNTALQFGKEFGNRGQCNPTYFT